MSALGLTLALTLSLLLASTNLTDAIARLPRGASVQVGWKVPTKMQVRFSSSRGYRECSTMMVLATLQNGTIDRVRLDDCDCEANPDGEPVQILPDIDPASSIAYLRAHLRDDPKQIVTAIALHDHPDADPVLIDLARHDSSSEVRRNSLFWLGQRAGDKAAGELRRAVDDDPDDDVKAHAVFAISQLPRERSVPILLDLAKHHKNRNVRKKAMFWLAQSNDPRAIDLFEQILLR